MNTAIERRGTPATPSIEKIDGLIEWVVAAPVEEVCWRLTELGTMRDWLRTQKAATSLRIRAVRLELIALRKVATGGLAAKIAGSSQLQSAARWLATLNDIEFAEALDEIDGEKTPIALYRADRAEREAMSAALSGDEGSSDWKHRKENDRSAIDDDSRRQAATAILRDVIESGEPFTIAEAAERLADRLNLDIETREDTAEGLREMVRSAIRRGDRSVPVDEWSRLPVAFTVNNRDDTYTRIPASTATVGHLVAHEAEVRQRAVSALRHADELRDLIVQISMELRDDPDPDELEDAHMRVQLAPVIDRIRRSSGWVEHAIADVS